MTSRPSICTIADMGFDFNTNKLMVLRNVVTSGKFMVPIIIGMVLLSGFRSSTFSWDHLQAGGPPIANTLLIAWFSGSVMGPLLTPWLPGQHAATKGLMAGLLGLLLFPASCFFLHLEPLDVLMALLVIPSVTFFLMTKHIHPIPLAGVALAAGIWIAARFI